MDYLLPLTPSELNEMQEEIDFRDYCQAILPLEIAVLDTQIKKDLSKAVRSSAKHKTFLWITISPPDCTMQEFMKCTARMQKKKWIANNPYIYVIEQRKDELWWATAQPSYDNIGKHIHLIVNTTYAKSRVINELSKTFKCGAQSIHHTTHIMEHLQDKKDYCLGLKTGDGKEQKQKGDVLFRQKNNLSNYYTNGGSQT